MVVKITTPKMIARALNYNEKKVQKGEAACLYAANFLKDAKDLNFHEKLERFTNRNALNTRAKIKMIHISLNFHPSEKLDREKLQQIADSYMSKIGFAEQPYLVYQHFDAGHPHLHIVSTLIRENGKRIDTFNIGRNASEKARKETEKEFHLFKAGKEKKEEKEVLPQKISYGKVDTKRAITAVLEYVLKNFYYTSLPGLNAVLGQYNVLADRGSKESRTFRNGGIVYRVLDEEGRPQGVGIKASAIYFKPTLKYLEERFNKNKVLRAPFVSKLKLSIDWALAKQPQNLEAFINELKSEGIIIVLRKNEANFIYGITYLDFRTRGVFNGSDLGKGYSAKAIQEKLENSKTNEEPVTLPKKIIPDQSYSQSQQQPQGTTINTDLLYDLLKTESPGTRLPYHLLKKKRKKRKI
jgi:hypothetical protein